MAYIGKKVPFGNPSGTVLPSRASEPKRFFVWRSMKKIIFLILLAAAAWYFYAKKTGKPLCPPEDPTRGITYQEANNLCRKQ